MLTSHLPFGSQTEAQSLANMQRGLELGNNTGLVGSVRLSPSAIELLRGLLHYVTEVLDPI
jgi:hypothetical protein